MDRNTSLNDVLGTPADNDRIPMRVLFLLADIEEHGGLDEFLDLCHATTTDIYSTYDVTDDEWARIQKVVD